jgi:hypothetical protein
MRCMSEVSSPHNVLLRLRDALSTYFQYAYPSNICFAHFLIHDWKACGAFPASKHMWSRRTGWMGFEGNEQNMHPIMSMGRIHMPRSWRDYKTCNACGVGNGGNLCVIHTKNPRFIQEVRRLSRYWWAIWPPETLETREVGAGRAVLKGPNGIPSFGARSSNVQSTDVCLPTFWTAAFCKVQLQMGAYSYVILSTLLL